MHESNAETATTCGTVCPMGSVTKQIEIAAAPEVVWSILRDVRRLPLLSPSTVRVDGPVRLERVGQEFDQTVEVAGRQFTSKWKVTAIESCSRLVIEGSVLPGTRYRMTEILDSTVPDRTTFSLTMDYQLPFGPLGRLASKLGAEGRATEEAQTVLRGVKAASESQSRAPSE